MQVYESIVVKSCRSYCFQYKESDATRTISISDLVRHLKASSTRWVKGQDYRWSTFSWQKGYGVFSVSHSARNQVAQYIRAQRQHHQYLNFQEEYRQILIKHEVEFDEKYVWD